MTIEIFQNLLGWCAVINYGLLLCWAVVFIFAHDWMYRFHTRWFAISKERFDELHYLLIGIYKILVLAFVIIPYIALVIVA